MYALKFSGALNGGMVQVKQIIEVYQDTSIQLPAKTMGASGSVKLPYDKIISFEDFQTDMARRKNTSKTLNLHE